MRFFFFFFTFIFKNNPNSLFPPLTNSLLPTKAIKSLEEIIDLDPVKNLNENVVFNLCILYELHSESSPSKKKNIVNLIQKYGSESFDMSVVKLPNSS